MNTHFFKLAWLLATAVSFAACGGSDDDNDPIVYEPVETPTGTVTISTPQVSDITANSAVLRAQVTASQGLNVTSRGFCYATTTDPTTDNLTVKASLDDMLSTLGGLRGSTTYYVRGFAVTAAGTYYSSTTSFTTAEEEEVQVEGPEALKRVSVHDPSVVWDPDSKTYYIFGSHRDNAKSTNMMTWSKVSIPWATANSTNAANSAAFVTPAVKKVTKGGKEVDFPAFSALAWAKRGNSSYNIDGNLWAPDVIYNTAMKKWCMYMSVNGDNWYSSIVLLTSDKITGPYLYQGPVVISGFHTGSAYKDTDLELVIGTQTVLPNRYTKPWASTSKPSYPNCIDPCVFYDEQGKLWMSYGSWSGGIFILELDEQTGLRDYDVTYATSASSDPYFGTKIAGGYYVSGEGSYIEYVGGYYYLFLSYGGLAAGGVATDYNNGGYQMRVFRSKNPNGPYVDGKNASAVFTSFQTDFGPSANDGNRGVNIFGAYGEWGNQTVGSWSERSQGHNSVIAAEDGRTYLVYHTRFQNRGEGHEVRVHQLFQNEEDWLVAAPFEYTGEVMKSAQIATKQLVPTASIPGKYKVLVHNYKLDHTAKAYTTPKEVTLMADGTIAGDYTGTWSIKEGTSYVTVNIGQEYKGVMIMQTLEPKNEKAVCFTALRSATGVTVWGYKYAEN